jgi:hypothetical protein
LVQAQVGPQFEKKHLHIVVSAFFMPCFFFGTVFVFENCKFLLCGEK